MQVLGLDITAERPKALTNESVKASDVVFRTVAATPAVLSMEALQEWKLDDPAGLGIYAVRPIRDDIRARIEQLVSEID